MRRTSIQGGIGSAAEELSAEEEEGLSVGDGREHTPYGNTIELSVDARDISRQKMEFSMWEKCSAHTLWEQWKYPD